MRTRNLFPGSLLVAAALVVPAAPLVASPVAAAPAPGTAAGVGAGAEQRYIVTFEPGTDPRDGAADLRGNGVQVDKVLSHVFSGAVVRLPSQAANALTRNPRISSMEPDRVATASESQRLAPWGLDRSDQRALPLDTSYTWTQNGSGVTAYVVDTGIRADHRDLGGRVAAGYTSINDGRGTGDCHGHGTHVAGTVGGSTYGIAKGVKLVPVRVLGCEGTGSYSGIIAGLDWIVKHHAAGAPAVANVSLGGPGSSALDAAVQTAVNDGVTVVAAAGNDGANACNYSPARAAAAVTVGATGSTDARASFSNYGSCLDLFAPGVGIASTWHTSTTATASLSGTSMAAPHVAGVAATLLQADPSMSPAHVTSSMLATATTGRVSNAGTGSANRLLWSGATPQYLPAQPAAPKTVIKAGPAHGGVVPARRARFSYAASTRSTFRCTVDGSVRRCGTSSLTLSRLRPGSHRFTVAARAADGSFGPAPSRVWTVPKNNTKLRHSGGWRKARARGHYLKSFSTSRKRGATLRTKVRNTRQLALVATTGRGHGTVKVYLGSRLLKRVKLSSRTLQKKRIIPIADFGGSRRRGAIRIVVASAGKPVKVEGFAAATQ